MKLLIAIFLLCIYSQLSAQQTIDEKELRARGDYEGFLNEVKRNSPTNCLCKQNEYPVFSFATKNNKIASLCISKKVTKTSSYLVYRFGTKSRIELAYPSDTLNSFSAFTYSYYSRGGGKQNAAMDLNSVEFTNKGITYKLNDDWSSEDNSTDRGIIVTADREYSINSKGKVTGGLYIFRSYDVIKFDPDRVY